jgi:hypothetical protein
MKRRNDGKTKKIFFREEDLYLNVLSVDLLHSRYFSCILRIRKEWNGVFVYVILYIKKEDNLEIVDQ